MNSGEKLFIISSAIDIIVAEQDLNLEPNACNIAVESYQAVDQATRPPLPVNVPNKKALKII